MATVRKSGTRRNESTFFEAAAIVLMTLSSVQMTSTLTVLDDTTAKNMMVMTSQKATGHLSEDALITVNNQHPTIKFQEDMQNTLKGTHFLIHQHSDHARRKLVEFSRSFVSLEFIDEQSPKKAKNSKENYTNFPSIPSYMSIITGEVDEVGMEPHAHLSSVVRRSAEESICASARGPALCDCSGADVTCDGRSLPPHFPRGRLPDSCRRFSAARSNLTAIPAFAAPSGVAALRLRGNDIEAAHAAALATYPALQELDLSDNKLRALDLSELELPHLSVLCASSNRLRTFASQPFKLTALSLDRNQLSDISFVSTFTSLEILNLSHNHIFNISRHTFEHLNKLFYLNLQDNAIVNADFLSNVTKFLKSLFLGNNKITRISSMALANSFIVYLHINNNSLTNVDFLVHMNNVLELNINDNNLVELKKEIFVNKENIKLISASGTNLSSLEFALSIPSLVGLAVADNNIMCLPSQFFQQCKLLKTLYFNGNPMENLSCTASSLFFNNVAKECRVVYTRSSNNAVEIIMRQENVDDYFNCMLENYVEFLRTCEQHCKSGAERTFLSNFLLIFVVLINVL